MAGKLKLQLLRINNDSQGRPNSTEILLDGQPLYDKATNKLYIGDGSDKANELVPIIGEQLIDTSGRVSVKVEQEQITLSTGVGLSRIIIGKSSDSDSDYIELKQKTLTIKGSASDSKVFNLVASSTGFTLKDSGDSDSAKNVLEFAGRLLKTSYPFETSGGVRCNQINCSDIISSGGVRCNQINCSDIISSGGVRCNQINCSDIISTGNITATTSSHGKITARVISSNAYWDRWNYTRIEFATNKISLDNINLTKNWTGTETTLAAQSGILKLEAYVPKNSIEDNAYYAVNLTKRSNFSDSNWVPDSNTFTNHLITVGQENGVVTTHIKTQLTVYESFRSPIVENTDSHNGEPSGALIKVQYLSQNEAPYSSVGSKSFRAYKYVGTQGEGLGSAYGLTFGGGLLSPGEHEDISQIGYPIQGTPMKARFLNSGSTSWEGWRSAVYSEDASGGPYKIVVQNNAPTSLSSNTIYFITE